MSTRISYIPYSDAARAIWMNNFNIKLPNYATLTGITVAELTSVQDDTNMYQYLLNMLETYKQTVNNITSYKNLAKHAVAQQHLGSIPVLPNLATAPTPITEGIFDRVSNLVKRIKASVNYTSAMGQDLGIVAPIQVIDVNTMQPELKITLDAGRPHIKSTKGYADAIDLYADRKDGIGFVLIGRLLKADYIDTVNLPATVALAEWDYKAMYVIGNSNVGLMSSIESVVVKKL